MDYIGGETLTTNTRDWSPWSHDTQWCRQLPLWAGIKSARVPTEEPSIHDLSAGNAFFPTFNPRAELQYLTEDLRVKSTPQNRAERNCIK